MSHGFVDSKKYNRYA